MGIYRQSGRQAARELAKDQGYNPDGSLKKYFCYYGKLLSGIEYKIEGDLQDGQRVYRAQILRDIGLKMAKANSEGGNRGGKGDVGSNATYRH